jgi:serine/threonine protein kinase
MVSAPDIPGYQVGGVLGSGGFATVYRCWQLRVGREVAVKVDNRVLLSERDRRRFVREVTAAGRLSGHPHVIDVYDAGTLPDGRPFLVMELCPAGSLADALHREGPMSPEQVRDIGIRISDALAAAHAAGVLHRDIKPANILVNRYGLVGLSDFGLASIMAAEGQQSASREALTPAFAPPEAFRGEEPTVAGDIYSLVATLYALLAGRPPRFPVGPRDPGIATIIALHDQPVDDVPGTPPGLMATLRRGLAADPAARPPSAAALRDALAAPPAPPGIAARTGMPAHSGVTAQTGMPPQTGMPAHSGTPAQTGMPSRTGSSAHPGISAGPGRYVPPGGPAPPGRSAPSRRPGPAVGEPAPWASASSMSSAPPAHPAPPPAPASPAYPHSPARLAPPGLPAPRTPPAHSMPRAGQAVAPGSFGIPSGPGPARTEPPAPVRRRRPVMLLVAAAAGIVLLVGAAAVVGARFLAPGASTGAPAAPASTGAGSVAAPAAGFGVPTVTSGCPAAPVPGAGARCPRSPECWAGPVISAGSASARSLPCTAPHVWQTFAIAILPAGVRTFDQPTVAGNLTVRAVCSMRVLLASRRVAARQLPAGAWEIFVLPPDEAAFDSGARAYRCLAHLRTGADPSTSQFGPQADQGDRAEHGGSGRGRGKNG